MALLPFVTSDPNIGAPILHRALHHAPVPATGYGHPAPAPTPAYEHPSPAPHYGYPDPAPTYVHPSPTPINGHPTPKPAPTYVHPTPAPTPVYGHPAPKPAPTYGHPSPAPIHVHPAPAQVYGHPAPKPTPEYGHPTPDPVYGHPAPKFTPAYEHPAPAPVYGNSAPKPTPTYEHPSPAPTNSHPAPAPSYGHQAPHFRPKNNCSVLDVVEVAETCTPTITTECNNVNLPVKLIQDVDYTYTVTRTVCTESVELFPHEVCIYNYAEKTEDTIAKTVSVTYKKEINIPMVTVCQPGHKGYGHGGYDGYGHNYCREVAQETAYNVPIVSPVDVGVTVAYPEPQKVCVDKPISLPVIQCDDIKEERTIKVPNVIESEVPVAMCFPKIGQ